MTKYSKYKISNIDWLDKIPEHWKDIDVRKAFIKNEEKNEELQEDNLLTLSYGSIKRKNIKTANGLLPASFDNYQILQKGMIVLRMLDLQNDKNSLRVGYVKEQGIITSAYIGLDKKIDSNTKYFYYLLHFMDLIKHFYNGGGGVRQSIGYTDFRRELIILPPKPEQTAIANFLDYKLEKINRFIAKKKQLLLLSIERRKSLTKQIINSNSIKFLRLSLVSPLIERPIERQENNSYTPVGLYNRGRGVFHKSKTLGKNLGDSTFFKIEEGDVILSGQFAWEGSVALARKNDVGCIASHRYPILKCNEKYIIPEFLFSFFTISEGHFFLEINSVGAAGRNRPLNPRKLIKEKIPIPSIDKQKELIEVIRSEITLKVLIEKEISLVEEYKTALIAETVTGKIDVRDFKIPQTEAPLEMVAEEAETY